MSKNTNDGLSRSGTECFRPIAVPIWQLATQQWASISTRTERHSHHSVSWHRGELVELSPQPSSSSSSSLLLLLLLSQCLASLQWTKSTLNRTDNTNNKSYSLILKTRLKFLIKLHNFLKIGLLFNSANYSSVYIVVSRDQLWLDLWYMSRACLYKKARLTQR